MKGAAKGRSGIVAGVVVLFVVGFSVVSSLARRIGVVEPRVRIERGASLTTAQTAALARMQVAGKAMCGEVATTAERLREASALAATASLLAVSERGTSGAALLRKMAAENLLPPGVALTDRAKVLATPYGSLVLHFRSAPLGVEVLSLGKDKAAGPALIVRVAGDIPGAEGVRVWSATRLDEVQLPRPFAAESEVIAAGWQPGELPRMQ
ncbi:MAG: hypothetical protein MOB07_14030 [Acidobacteria bacterium]|nr:hypothetical protein [Acidobacteriota bacterium]